MRREIRCQVACQKKVEKAAREKAYWDSCKEWVENFPFKPTYHPEITFDPEVIMDDESFFDEDGPILDKNIIPLIDSFMDLFIGSLEEKISNQMTNLVSMNTASSKAFTRIRIGIRLSLSRCTAF